ncbi:GNAT family N-acetyltransferase [Prauserella marina]|uniref:GNAT family N-acetyltransferase n=1 Tax=Prauserella marina TaxID=530584 RepID=UPI001FE8E5C9|nr:GNAT family N-acetyltransferase [Prauserella marina]
MSTGGELRLRLLGEADEIPFRAAHRAMLDEGFEFGWGLREELEWSAYLRLLADQRDERGRKEGTVPATLLVAEVGGRIVGRTSVRHTLDDALLRVGGHIGYAVLPPYRRRGYATEILRQSVIVARSLGVDRILVTCDEDNAASATVIEANGGRWENTLPAGPGRPGKRRYWIG